VNQELSEKDVMVFAGIRVPFQMLVEAGIRRVTDAEARVVLGPNRSGDMAGIVFPYIHPETHRRVTARLRRDNPEVDSQGKPQRKYLSPFGDRRHLYFSPGVASLLRDVTVPIVAVEAEKSVLSIMALSSRADQPLLAIGLGGCWGWRGKIGSTTSPTGERIDEKGPLPDLFLVTWEGREVFVCFDANTRTNPKVRQARSALARDLHGRGARVRLVELPELPNVNGPDDYIGLHGDEAFLSLLESSVALPQSVLAEANKTLAELEAAPTKPRDPETASRLLREVAGVQDVDHRNVLAKRTAKVLGWPKSEVQSRVRARMAEELESAARAKEAARRAYLRSLNLDRSALVKDLEDFFENRAYLPVNAALVLSFFSLNTWVFDAFDSTPYISLDSATPGCGKNTVMNLLEAVCARPKMLASASEAALFRTIDQYHPTVLLDEAELLAGRGERAEYLRSIANAGYKKGGSVPRCVGQTNELQNFEVFCPKVFAAIGGLTGALLDRCIVLHMEKAPAGHVRKSTRQRHLRRDSAQIRERIEAYAEQYRENLILLYQKEPDEGYWPQLRDRELELWGPLLIHARLIGPQCEGRLSAAALSFSRAKLEIEAQDRDVALTIELLHAVEQGVSERFAPAELVPVLVGDGWGEKFSRCRDDRAKAATVGRFFGRFRLSSRQHSREGTSYLRQEAIEKLTAHIPGGSVTPVTRVTEELDGVESKAAGDSVTDVTVRATGDSGDDGPRRPPAIQSIQVSDGPDTEEAAIASTEIEVDL
jgi:hypothetical protein